MYFNVFWIEWNLDCDTDDEDNDDDEDNEDDISTDSSIGMYFNVF